MLFISGVHAVASIYLFASLVGTAFHVAGLSVCGHYSEPSLILLLVYNMVLMILYLSNFKFAGDFDLHIVKKTRLIMFLLMITSLLLLVSPFLPGLFCKYNDFTRIAATKGVAFFFLVVTECLVGTCYFIRYEKFKVHKEIYSKPIDTSLTL